MTFEQLQKEKVKAIKERFPHKVEVLSSVIGAVQNAAIAKKCKDNITEDLVNEVLLKEKKILQEQIDTCPDDRPVLKQGFIFKMNFLEKYCPKLMVDEDEIEEYINYIIDNYDVDISNTSTAMKTIMPHLKGKADMKIANSVIRGMCF